MDRGFDTDFIDWNDAFENGAYIPGAERLPAQWAERSRRLREFLASKSRIEADIAYGDSPRQSLDLLHPVGESRGLVVVVHGGYWHRFDKHSWSFLASGALAHGLSVAVPSYRLAPQVSIAEITQDIHAAVCEAAQRVAGPLRLTGHSAGAHLVTRLLCTDSRLPSAVSRRLTHVLAVSGIYDLRPLMAHDMNRSLQLDSPMARAESPVFASVHATAVPTTLWVGASERPEFLRQTRLLCETWQAQMPAIRAWFEADRNHFSVIEGLSHAGSALTRSLLQKD